MDFSFVVAALRMVVFLSGAVLFAALVGGVVAGVVRVVTQIEDQAINFFGRFVSVTLLIYMASNYASSEILQYTARVWGGSDIYK